MSAEFSITRTAILDAPAPAVFAQLEDFRKWRNWSFWEKTDPSMERTFTGAERGVGARYEWSGNAKAGAGSMEITGASAGRRVLIELRFLKPFKATNPTVITLEPLGPERTEVTWQMTGTRGPVMRALTRLVKMDDVLARQIDEGLEALGRAAAAEG
ncbi:SRPBCC family protein [Dietzia sp. NPDC055343]